ncbi:MAG: hypothetical protein K0U93_29335 [Gammaproteobacteria bacterium]|nr:hypothetical protein [Gammaproteobacteria bacterium]
MTDDAEAGALAAVDNYLVALNARDTQAIRRAFHFPHVRIGASGIMTTYPTPDDYDFDSFFSRTIRDGWHHSEWDSTEVVFATPAKVHVAVNFSRYREDGSLIGTYFSLYIVTCRNGHWAIHAGSGDGG